MMWLSNHVAIDFYVAVSDSWVFVGIALIVSLHTDMIGLIQSTRVTCLQIREARPKKDRWWATRKWVMPRNQRCALAMPRWSIDSLWSGYNYQWYITRISSENPPLLLVVAKQGEISLKCIRWAGLRGILARNHGISLPSHDPLTFWKVTLLYCT